MFRLRWSPDRKQLLAAAMYAGFCVLSVDQLEEEEPAWLLRDSADGPRLAYGIAWHAETGTVATASFYDYDMRVWQTTPA